MAKLASKVYGDALFDLAVEEGTCAQYLEEVNWMRKVLKENPEVLAFIRHPMIDREEKMSFMETCFKGQVSEELLGLLEITITKGRFQEIEPIFDYFIARVKEYERIGKAKVIAPFEMSDVQKQAVEKKLLSTTRYEKMEIEYQMDKSLIGGLVIRIGDRVVDTSIRHKLDTLTTELMQVSLT